MKSERKIRAEYFLTVLAASGMYFFANFFQSTPYYAIRIINQLFLVIPSFALSIAIPFLLILIVRIIKSGKKEIRIFYLIISFYFVFFAASFFYPVHDGFAMFKVIAAAGGLFLDMGLHYAINYKNDKKNIPLN